MQQIQKLVHELATANGWNDNDCALSERILLICNDLSASVESIRNDEPYIWQEGGRAPLGEGILKILPSSPDWKTEIKPRGMQIKLATAVMRIMDIFESQGWSLENAIRIKHQYNKTRNNSNAGPKAV
jgi:hypothetical protein